MEVKKIVTPKGHVVKVQNGKLFINDKWAGDLSSYVTPGERPIPERLMQILNKARRDPKSVLMYCLDPVNIVCTQSVADMITEGLAEYMADQKANREREERLRNDAIAACPVGYEPATYKSSLDGMIFVEAVSDKASAIVGEGCENRDGIYYVETGRFAQSRESIATVKAREAAENERIDACIVEAKTTGQRVAIRHWMTDRCMNHHRDCSFDNATEWVYPDGHCETTYTCCF